MLLGDMVEMAQVLRSAFPNFAEHCTVSEHGSQDTDSDINKALISFRPAVLLTLMCAYVCAYVCVSYAVWLPV